MAVRLAIDSGVAYSCAGAAAEAAAGAGAGAAAAGAGAGAATGQRRSFRGLVSTVVAGAAGAAATGSAFAVTLASMQTM